MYQALYRKYRPKTFDDVVGQEHITETLKNQVRGEKYSHAYLFNGTRGTGKTTCAKILAKAVNCEHPVNGNPCNCCPTCRGIDDGTIMDVVELDAASNNGVDNVRALRDEAIFSPANAKKRVYIVDEVHMMSNSAFNALLKIMEEPPEHLMFILATTELNKVPSTILSRCQKYSFRRISSSIIAQRLRWVAQQENLNLTEKASELLGRLANGSMRDGLSLMDQVLGDGNITEESVLATTGLAGSLFTAQLLTLIHNSDTSGALQLFNKLWNDGANPALLLDELISLVRDVLLYIVAPQSYAELISGAFDPDTLGEFAALMRPSQLMSYLETAQKAQDKLRVSYNQRMTLELCIIALCDPSLSDDLSALRARMDRLEAGIPAGSVPVMQAPKPAVPKRELPKPAAPAPKQEAPKQEAPKQEAPKPAPVEDRPPWDEEPPAPVQDRAPWDEAPPEEPKTERPPRRKLSYEEMMAGATAPKVKKEPAPAPAEDRPPWDEAPPFPADEDLPPLPEEDYERPPLPEEPPMLPDEPAFTPAPKKQAPKPAPGNVNPNWEPFMNIATQALPAFLTGLLPQCSADFADDCITIHAPLFPFGQLTAPANLQKLKDCGQQFYGHPVEVKVLQATSDGPRQATRSLDDLKKFDIVKFK